MDGIVPRQERREPEQRQHEQPPPAGQMMTFASEVTKDYTYKYLLPKHFAEAHQLGDIHIHDLDYLPDKRRPPVQYDRGSLERGFRTKNGSIYRASKVCFTLHHHLPDQPERGSWRTGNPRLRLLHGKRVAKSFRKHPASFINFYVAMERRNTGGRESNPHLNQGTSASIKSTKQNEHCASPW